MSKAKDPKRPRPKRAGPATQTNPTTGAFQISDELWAVLEPLIPKYVNTHRLGGGRPRVPNRTCANGIFFVLRTGCQWKALDATGICSGSTAHLRFQEWVGAGVFLELWRVGLERYDELKGLDWSWLSMDGAMTKAPLGGGGGGETGANPTDRGKRGVKRSLLTEAQGVPVGLAVDEANRHDMKLVRATLDSQQPDHRPAQSSPRGCAWTRATTSLRYAARWTSSVSPLTSAAGAKRRRPSNRRLGSKRGAGWWNELTVG